MDRSPVALNISWLWVDQSVDIRSSVYQYRGRTDIMAQRKTVVSLLLTHWRYTQPCTKPMILFKSKNSPNVSVRFRKVLRFMQYMNNNDTMVTGKQFPRDASCLPRSWPGSCITNATWRCPKNFSQWERSFHWKLCCHWLKFLRQCQIAVVIQGPGFEPRRLGNSFSCIFI